MSQPDESADIAIDVLDTAPPVTLFAQPLDYIFAEHFRQRVLCNVLDCIADEKPVDHIKAKAALDYLNSDFGLHILDEEKDLFPMLLRRVQPEDDLGDVMVQLIEEHAADRIDAEDIKTGLQELFDASMRQQIAESFQELLHRFAANERQHLTVENAIVLPLARIRLTEDDLRNLSSHMAQRRGLVTHEILG